VSEREREREFRIIELHVERTTINPLCQAGDLLRFYVNFEVLSQASHKNSAKLWAPCIQIDTIVKLASEFWPLTGYTNGNCFL
jgi:hypothetical protein